MTLTNPFHLKQTEAFIAQNPSDVVVHRVEKVSDGMGGWTQSAPSDLPSQTIRLVGIGGQREFQTNDGELVIVTNAVIGKADADLRRRDTFDIAGRTYEVLYVEREPPWRTQAFVMEVV